MSELLNIGVDYGVRHVAVACYEHSWATSFSAKNDDRGEELKDLVDEYKCWMPRGSQSHLWIESAIQGISGNVQTAVGMAATQGAIMAAHWGPVTMVAPSSWKAGVVGNGHASKADATTFLKESYMHLATFCDNQNEIDAMCLAIYGRMLTGGEIAPPVPKPKKRKVKP